MLLLSIALTASTIVTPASAMLGAFREFCPADIPPQAALSGADAQGWHRIASARENERQLEGPAPMTLHSSDDEH